MKIFYSFLYSPAQKGPSESKVKPEGHWLLRSPAKARKAQLTSLLEHRHPLPVSPSLERCVEEETMKNKTKHGVGNKQEWRTSCFF